MKYVFLSPHFDDAVYSCGGYIYDLVAQGNKVEIWTICGGFPLSGSLSSFAKSLHARWEIQTDIVNIRRKEDIEACRLLKVIHFHFDVPDCIYRKNDEGNWLYSNQSQIFGDIKYPDTKIITNMVKEIELKLAAQQVIILGPLSVGGHVDHRLTRKIMEELAIPQKAYYPEFPYTRELPMTEILKHANSMKGQSYPISPEAINNWRSAIEIYASQMNSFWLSSEEIEKDISSIVDKLGGQKFYSQNHINII